MAGFRSLQTVATSLALALGIGTVSLSMQPACVPLAGMLLASDFTPAVSVPMSVELKQARIWPSCRRNMVNSDHHGRFVLPWDFNPESTWQTQINFSGIIFLDSPINRSWSVGTPNETGPDHQQMAWCPEGPLVGDEVQTRFLNALLDPRVRCAAGKLVESTLVLRKGDGSFLFCQSLCPLQTCAALRGRSTMSDTLQDDCLMGNVRKNFQHANGHKAASPEVALLWLIKHFCPVRLGDPQQITVGSVRADQGGQLYSDMLVADIRRSLARLALTYDPLHGAGDGKYIVLDVSGSMGGVLAALRTKLGKEYPKTTIVSVHDSSFRTHGSMGYELLKVVKGMAERGSVVVVVSDFQDGADSGFCDSLGRAVRQQDVVLALESLQLELEPCLSQVAASTGTSVNVGRSMRK